MNTRDSQTSTAANAEPSCGTVPLSSRGCRAATGKMEAPLYSLRCVQCQGLFYLCRSCFHGQNTCQLSCRQQRRVVRTRAARRAHRQSEDGRFDHRDQERGRRARQRQQRPVAQTRVGDLGSPLEVFSGSVPLQPPQAGPLMEPIERGPQRTPDAQADTPLPRAPCCPPGSPRHKALPRCSHCGRSSRYVVHRAGGPLRRPVPRQEPP